jgi:hypothetical protein
MNEITSDHLEIRVVARERAVITPPHSGKYSGKKNLIKNLAILFLFPRNQFLPK